MYLLLVVVGTIPFLLPFRFADNRKERKGTVQKSHICTLSLEILCSRTPGRFCDQPGLTLQAPARKYFYVAASYLAYNNSFSHSPVFIKNRGLKSRISKMPILRLKAGEWENDRRKIRRIRILCQSQALSGRLLPGQEKYGEVRRVT